MDLHQFADRPSILGGMLIYHNDVHALDIPYCTLTCPYWFWPVFPYGGFRKLKFLRHTVHKEYRRSIREHPDTLFFIHLSNYPVARFSNAVYITRAYTPSVGVNNPFRDRADTHRGTFTFQISLAIYLGFKKAYLVGHDYTHFPSRTLHFYEKGEGVMDGNRNFSRDFIQYARQHIDLVTVTLDGRSETMDYITYEDLTGQTPGFRENAEILDRRKLQSLDTWFDYTIF